MSSVSQGPAFFNQAVADKYDQQAARLAALRDEAPLLFLQACLIHGWYARRGQG